MRLPYALVPTCTCLGSRGGAGHIHSGTVWEIPRGFQLLNKTVAVRSLCLPLISAYLEYSHEAEKQVRIPFKDFRGQIQTDSEAV